MGRSERMRVPLPAARMIATGALEWPAVGALGESWMLVRLACTALDSGACRIVFIDGRERATMRAIESGCLEKW